MSTSNQCQISVSLDAIECVTSRNNLRGDWVKRIYTSFEFWEQKSKVVISTIRSIQIRPVLDAFNCKGWTITMIQVDQILSGTMARKRPFLLANQREVARLPVYRNSPLSFLSFLVLQKWIEVFTLNTQQRKCRLFMDT